MSTAVSCEASNVEDETFKVHRAIARALLTSTCRTAPRASRVRVTQVLPAILSPSRTFSHYTARFSPEEPIKEEPSEEQAKDIKEESIIEQIPQQSTEDAAVTQEHTSSSTSAEFSSQEIAATQESTDAVLESSEAISSSPVETEDQAAAAVSETTDQVKGHEPVHNVYVANLFFDVTHVDLQHDFKKFGDIRSVKVVTDERGLSKGYGFVAFANKADAEAAIAAMDGIEYKGRKLVVQTPRPRESRRGVQTSDHLARFPQSNEPSKTLFIGNLSYQMSDRDLSDLFRDVQGVIDVRVAIDRRSGQPRGFSHADFVDVSSAMKAREALQDKEFYGRRLLVNYSHQAKLQAPRARTTQR